MRKQLWNRGQRRRGIIAVFVALCLIVITGMVAFAIDGGLLYLELRTARMTADAAAMAAACDLYQNYPTYSGVDTPGTASTAAFTTASANGYTNDGVNSIVTVNIPPQSGIYSGQAGYAEVIITQYVSRAFSRIWADTPIPVRARAVARGAWVAPNAGVLILNYSGSGDLSVQGNGASTVTGGPVIVNSSSASGTVASGNGQIVAPEFDLTGGLKLDGGGNLSTSPTAGQVFLGMHPTPDPLAYLPAPTMPPAGTMTTVSLGNGNTEYTLSPGSYSNLPTFTSGDVVILQQASANSAGGIFYINGGGFKSTGASIIMDPNTSGGVMIYNEPDSSASSEKIQITGNSSGTVNLSPLTSGPYAGMMLWQDRNSSVGVLVEGNGNFSINGTFYAASALLTINGNASSSTGYYVDGSGNTVSGASQIGSQYISQDLSLGGNGNISINYNGPQLAKTRVITLVE